MAAHYGNALDDFVVAHNVEMLRPVTQKDIEWGWTVVSLKDILSGELLPLCVRDKDVGPKEDLGGCGVRMQTPSLGQAVVSEASVG